MDNINRFAHQHLFKTEPIKKERDNLVLFFIWKNQSDNAYSGFKIRN